MSSAIDFYSNFSSPYGYLAAQRTDFRMPALFPVAARAAIDDPAVKAALKEEVDRALARGVFGSPFIFVDGEPFWGFDRFDQIERWLATGGF